MESGVVEVESGVVRVARGRKVETEVAAGVAVVGVAWAQPKQRKSSLTRTCLLLPTPTMQIRMPRKL